MPLCPMAAKVGEEIGLTPSSLDLSVLNRDQCNKLLRIHQKARSYRLAKYTMNRSSEETPRATDR